ncbi:hypothetical protein H1R20_g7079, partial [Candolleomyces eurysporus]
MWKCMILAMLWSPYGTLQWDEFYRYLIAFLCIGQPWTIFHYDLSQEQHGAPCLSGAQVVQPGHYILLSITGQPLRVGFYSAVPRGRFPVHSNAYPRTNHYRERARARDGKCLITGSGTQTWSRLHAAHIFSRAHDIEWVEKGYPSKITDTADEALIGGPTKIDSVQNVLTMRCDLHNAWDNFEFAVDPNNNYRITAFTNGNEDINGLYLQLGHIRDPTMRPLDELFTDHFMQCLFKHMKGAGELGTCDDHEDDSGDESDLKIGGAKVEEEGVELALAEEVFDRLAVWHELRI